MRRKTSELPCDSCGNPVRPAEPYNDAGFFSSLTLRSIRKPHHRITILALSRCGKCAGHEVGAERRSPPAVKSAKLQHLRTFRVHLTVQGNCSPNTASKGNQPGSQNPKPCPARSLRAPANLPKARKRNQRSRQRLKASRLGFSGK